MSYFLGENFDGKNGHRMKLPVKTAPRYIPPHLSKKKISIFFSLKPWHNLLPNYNQLQQDIPERTCLYGHNLHLIITYCQQLNLLIVHNVSICPDSPYTIYAGAITHISTLDNQEFKRWRMSRDNIYPRQRLRWRRPEAWGGLDHHRGGPDCWRIDEREQGRWDDSRCHCANRLVLVTGRLRRQQYHSTCGLLW